MHPKITTKINCRLRPVNQLKLQDQEPTQRRMIVFKVYSLLAAFFFPTKARQGNETASNCKKYGVRGRGWIERPHTFLFLAHPFPLPPVFCSPQARSFVRLLPCSISPLAKGTETAAAHAFIGRGVYVGNLRDTENMSNYNWQCKLNGKIKLWYSIIKGNDSYVSSRMLRLLG